MTEEQNPKDDEGKVYLGNKVPKVLRWVYAAFIVWMVVYVVKYLVPDLIQWLK